MKLVLASANRVTPLGPEDYVRIERLGRICYKSEHHITADSAVPFIRRIISQGHESVLEHVSVTYRIICDRGVSHELVRHRLASFSQESTRYCDYANAGDDINFVAPCFWADEDDSIAFMAWMDAMRDAERSYYRLRALGATPERARTVLPNSLKTEVAMTMNIRELRHFLKLRTSKAAHPQMREVARLILSDVRRVAPVFVEDIVMEE